MSVPVPSTSSEEEDDGVNPVNTFDVNIDLFESDVIATLTFFDLMSESGSNQETITYIQVLFQTLM